jgi:short-chain fatty acids transporter
MSNEQRNEGTTAMVRFGMTVADWFEKWFPDALVFAVLAVFIVYIAGLFLGNSPVNLAVMFGTGFWSIIPFTMQMALIIVGGYLLASSPPVYRFVKWLASVPQTPRGAIVYVAVISMLSSMIHWGFCLIFSGFLVREICVRIKNIDYRAIGAAAFLGGGSIWTLGFSSSAAMMMATKGSVPPDLYKICGFIPLTHTLFTWQNWTVAAIIFIVSLVICYLTAPSSGNGHTAEDYNIDLEPLIVKITPRKTPGEWFEYSPIVTVLMAAIAFTYLIYLLGTKGIVAALDLNTLNFFFIMLALLLHWRLRSFVDAVVGGVKASAGVLIQFPFYGAILVMITKSGVSDVIAKFFVAISNVDTFPILAGLYSALLGLIVPSAGGKWLIEAPYILAAGNTLQIHQGWIVQIYNMAEAIPNLINPFWMLPLMGLLKMKAREMVGYSAVQCIFHLPIILFLCWFFSKTFTYVPPFFP